MAVLLAGLGAASTAAATEFPGLDFAKMAELSAVVARVVITEEQSHALSETKIATFHRARVVEVLAGELDPAEAPSARDPQQTLPAEILVGLPGGTIGNIGQRVGGVPDLEVGVEYLVFLGAAQGPSFERGRARGVVGHHLGIYRVDGHKLFADDVLGGHPEVPRRLPRLRSKLQAHTPAGAPAGAGPAGGAPTPQSRAP